MSDHVSFEKDGNLYELDAFTDFFCDAEGLARTVGRDRTVTVDVLSVPGRHLITIEPGDETATHGKLVKLGKRDFEALYKAVETASSEQLRVLVDSSPVQRRVGKMLAQPL